MTSERQRHLRRERQSVERRRAGKQGDARETQRLQVEADMRRSFAQKRRRHIEAFVLWGVAVVIAATHLIEHTGALRIMSLSLEDLLIGWPVAGILGVAGGIIYGT